MANFNLSPIGNGVQFYYPSTGQPLNAGLLYTYSAGTTTPAATYTTSTGSIANANPIVLNATGQPPQEIWIASGVALKFYLTDSLGNPIWPIPYDNITGIGDTTAPATSEWVASGFTPVFSTTTSFTTAGNSTGIFLVNSRVKTTNSGGTVYGTVISATFAGGSTTVTILPDGASVLDSGLSIALISFLGPSDPSVPANFPYPLTVTANGSNFLTNIRLAKTVNYTVGNGVGGNTNDNGATIALSGGFFTLTFGSASTYPTPFAVRVINEDTYTSQGSGTQGRGKSISIQGYTFLLWPGQAFTAFKQNNIWYTDPPSSNTSFARWKLPGQITIYADNTNGVDTNDGLATGVGGAVKTIARAVLNLYQAMDCNNFQNTIQLADGTYTEAVVINNSPVGSNVFYLLGNTGTPDNVTWNATTNGVACLQINDAAEVITGGYKLSANGNTACTGISVHQTAICDINYPIDFSTFTSGTHMSTDGGGLINVNSGYNVNGNASVHVNLGPRCYMAVAGAITIAAGTVTIATVYAGNGSGCNLTLGPTIHFTGTVNGQKWAFTDLSFISVNGNTIFGSGAGNPVVGAGLSATGSLAV